MKSPLVQLLNFLPLALLASVPFSCVAAARGQAAPQAPVSYASVTQLNSLLAQLEEADRSAIADLSKLRVDRWKADGNTKRQVAGDAQSVLRNLQGALPTLVNDLRAAPEDMGATFKLYHNLDALHDVLQSVAETAGAFAPKDEYQPLANDANAIDSVRRAMADRVQNLATAKEAELGRLRAQLQAAQAAAATAPPKKVVVDDNEPEPPKKPAKKKKSSAKSTAPAQTDESKKPASTPQ